MDLESRTRNIVIEGFEMPSVTPPRKFQLALALAEQLETVKYIKSLGLNSSEYQKTKKDFL